MVIISWKRNNVKISSISTIPIYQLSCINLLVEKCEEINTSLRTFFWKGTQNKKRMALVAQDKICRPNEEGGLGLKNIKEQSKALGDRLIWRMYSNPNLKWVKILRKKYLKVMDSTSLFRMANPPRGFRIWNFMMNCRKLIMDKLT